MERTRPTAVLTTMRPAQAMRIFVSALALASVFALPAHAGHNPFIHGVPHVYQSTRDDDGADEFRRTLPLGPSTLILYITAGDTPSTTGTPCLPGVTDGGDGDELCVFHVKLAITGGHFTEFTPELSLGIVSTPSPGVYVSPFPTELEMNYLNAVSPLSAHSEESDGFHRLGELGVEITSGGAVVSVTKISQFVDSDSRRAINQRLTLKSDDIPPNIVAVPEPDVLLLLAAGLIGLFVLQRIRLAREG